MKNNYRTVVYSDKYYIQVNKGLGWLYVSTRFSGEGFNLFPQLQPFILHFYSNSAAVDYMKNVIIPYYEPQINIQPVQLNKVVEQIEKVGQDEKCIFELMRQMLEYDKKGETEKANAINKTLLDIHNTIEKSDKAGKGIFKKLFDIF